MLHSAGGQAETTIDPTLIRGLDTALHVFVSGLSSASHRGSTPGAVQHI